MHSSAHVSITRIEGGEVPSARVSPFVRPALDTPPPLRVAFAMEEHPLGARYVLDGGVWGDASTLAAVNAEVGPRSCAR